MYDILSENRAMNTVDELFLARANDNLALLMKIKNLRDYFYFECRHLSEM